MGLRPGPALLFAVQIKREFYFVVAEGWFTTQRLCTTEAESKSLVFAKQPDVPGETMAPKS